MDIFTHKLYWVNIKDATVVIAAPHTPIWRVESSVLISAINSRKALEASKKYYNLLTSEIIKMEVRDGPSI